MNSCAMSSTRPVYSKIPAEMESNTPFVINVVSPPGGYVVRTPSPIAIAIGVERAYAAPRTYGVNLFDFGHGAVLSRVPRPSPSNV